MTKLTLSDEFSNNEINQDPTRVQVEYKNKCTPKSQHREQFLALPSSPADTFMASQPECMRCSNIPNIVKLRTCMWRKPGSTGGGKKPPRDVPRGHLAVTVGEARRRFVIRADYLNHPLLQQLLDEAYEEYGQRKEGPLAIPCDEFLFQKIIHSLATQFSCTTVNAKKLVLRLWRDSRPILNSISCGSSMCKDDDCNGGGAAAATFGTLYY